MSRYAKMRKSNAQDILYMKPEYGDVITDISERLQEEGMCAYELEKNREELIKTAKAAIKKEQSMEEALDCPPEEYARKKAGKMEEHQTAYERYVFTLERAVQVFCCYHLLLIVVVAASALSGGEDAVLLIPMSLTYLLELAVIPLAAWFLSKYCYQRLFHMRQKLFSILVYGGWLILTLLINALIPGTHGFRVNLLVFLFVNAAAYLIARDLRELHFKKYTW